MASERLRKQAERQYGLLWRADLLDELTASQLQRAVKAGRLVPLGRGVFRVAGVPPSWRQRALAACLSYGEPVALSHRSAGRLWQLDGIAASGQLELTVPPARSGRRPGITTYRHLLPPAEVTEHLAVPVTTPARTLVDLAAVVPPGALERAVDDALRRGLTSATLLEACLNAPARRGSAGTRPLRTWVARYHRDGLGDSVWEDRVYRWIVDDGLPAPIRQYPLELAGTIRRIDLAYPVCLVAVEFDGWSAHGTRRRFDADRDRTTELALAGWLVVLVTSAQSRAVVVQRVRRALAQRGVV